MKDIVQSKHNSIYLKASIPALAARFKEEKALRPMIAHLTDDTALTGLLEASFRKKCFYQAATVYTIDGLTVEEIVEGLINTLA